MASYVGDVLSFYQDNQIVPSKNNGGNLEPDSRFYLKIKDGMEIKASSNSNIIFRTTDAVDFENPIDREIDVYERNSTGEPTQYLISKLVKAISATQVETSFIMGNDVDYPSISLTDTDIIQIVSVADLNNNKYYEVPYLAQESVFVEQANISANTNSSLNTNSSEVPYILEVQKVPRRFSAKINSNNTMDLQFGSGDTTMNDEQILPNTKNVGLGLANSVNRLNQGIDPSNFLKTNTFGIAPTNTTLTVKYLVGGGVESNINTGDLVNIIKIEYEEDLLSLSDSDLRIYNQAKTTIAVENIEPAVGGRGAESIEEIRQNALAMFGSQNRAVTRQDYIVRALSMPARYGSVAKVYVSPDGEIDNNSPASILASPNNIAEFTNLVDSMKGMAKSEIQKELVKYLSNKRTAISEVNNPFAINMYLLGYDSNKNLTQLNQAVKQNLKTYLGEYRMLTDAVNIIDGFIVNIGVDFEIICYQNYNKREVLANCLSVIQEYFNIDNWTFNKPINISEIELILANVEGVMSVPSVKLKNLCAGDGNYSPNKYNMDEATKGKIVYPSLDPCVFEVKFPNKDIKGRAL